MAVLPVRADPRRLPHRHGLGLSARLSLAALAAVAVLGMGGLGAGFLVSQSGQDQLAAAALRAQAQMLAKVLQRRGDAVLADATRLAADPALAAASRSRDPAALPATLSAARTRTATEAFAASVLDLQGRTAAHLPGAGLDADAEPDVVAQVLERGTGTAGPVVLLGVGFGLQAVVPIPAQGGGEPSTALALTAPSAPALAELSASTGAGALLLRADGTPVDGVAPDLPPGQPGMAQTVIGTTLLRVNGRVIQLGSVPLLNGAGARIGTELQVVDVTDTDGERRFTTVLFVLGGGCLVSGVAGTLLWFISLSLRPLSGVAASLHALNVGSTDIELAGEDRHDELGAIARAVRQLRDRSRDGAREHGRRERAMQRQQRFIAGQMAAMGDALDVGTRDELLANSADGGEGRLGILAAGFRVMSQQAIVQHARLDALVVQLRDALAARTELIGLQEQLKITATVQEDMLPAPLPPRPDIEARGGLLPAAEFGGDFFDFFPLGPGQVAAFLGNVPGGGLRAAFLMLTVRTLLKAVMTCGLRPAAAMARVNALLLSEARGGPPVSAIVTLLDANRAEWTCCRAGCAEPLMLRRLGDASMVRLGNNPPLGTGMTSFAEQVVALAPRTTLLLRGNYGTEGEDGRLLAALRACSDPAAGAVLNAAMSALTQGAGAAERDASCVALRYVAAPG